MTHLRHRMDQCLVERCQVNLTYWSSNITATSLDAFDISYWTVAALMIVFGLPLNAAIIHYEWYDGDPQKRSLSNRMMSSFIFSTCTAGVIVHMFAGFMR